jgi:hypothetical protein
MFEGNVTSSMHLCFDKDMQLSFVAKKNQGMRIKKRLTK